jgi:hypothetical protein
VISKHVMNVHRIRLKAPWQCEPVAAGIRWTRGFHRPTNLALTERVWLVVASSRGNGSIELNGRPVGNVTASVENRLEITPLLAPRNELAILLVGLSPDGSGPDLPAEVWLEIG